MPIKKAAIKALRQAKGKTKYNKAWRNKINYLVKKSRQSLLTKNKDEAQKWISQACQILDKAAQKKVIKKNNADRRKSRLTRALRELK